MKLCLKSWVGVWIRLGEYAGPFCVFLTITILPFFEWVTISQLLFRLFMLYHAQSYELYMKTSNFGKYASFLCYTILPSGILFTDVLICFMLSLLSKNIFQWQWLVFHDNTAFCILLCTYVSTHTNLKSCAHFHFKSTKTKCNLCMYVK